MIRLAILLALAGVTSAPAVADARNAVPAHLSGSFQGDHVSIRDEGGSGPVVMLIPGLSSPRAVWDGVIPALKTRHHVFSVQVNGFGGDDPRGNLRPGILEGAVAEIDAFLTGNRLAAPAIVGHSMGGLLAMMLMKAHPADVGRLMIVDSLPYIGDSFRPGVTVAQVEPRAREMRDQIAASYGKARDPAATAGIVNSLAVTTEARTLVSGWMAAADPRVNAQAMYEDMTTDLRPDVASLKAPITLVYPAPGDALYHAVFAGAPHVSFVPVPEAGHFVMLDRPAAFAEALEKFLG